MPDKLTPEQRKKCMRRVRSKDSKIEVRLRKALWHKGYRYRKNYKALPGKPDIAITKHKIAIFCDSSFWHGRDFDKKKPVDTNHEYWDSKIKKNMKRDLDVNRQLKEMGWLVLRFWDIEINKQLEMCVNTVLEGIIEAKIAK